ncbi:unnamed protein product, partial [Urochloa humidicola]
PSKAHAFSEGMLHFQMVWNEEKAKIASVGLH